MNELKLFENKEFGKVRVNLINNEPYFNLNDVCKILGLTNVSKVKSRLEPKGVTTSYTLTNGGKQNMTYINESNFYKCIFQKKY